MRGEGQPAVTRAEQRNRKGKAGSGLAARNEAIHARQDRRRCAGDVLSRNAALFPRTPPKSRAGDKHMQQLCARIGGSPGPSPIYQHRTTRTSSAFNGFTILQAISLLQACLVSLSMRLLQQGVPPTAPCREGQRLWLVLNVASSASS